MDTLDRPAEDSLHVSIAVPSPAAAAAAAAAAIHAGVAVLSHRALLELVTGFMTGYPDTKYKFVKEFDRTLLRDSSFTDARSRNSNNNNSSSSSGSHDAQRGVVLPHYAIAANDRVMLRVLFNLSKQPRYHDDTKLSFKRAMSFAVLYNRAEMLECLAELKEADPEWEWEHYLMPIALDRDDPDLKVVEWLW